MRKRCELRLSNQHVFQGDLIGAPIVSSGEMVFTTGMVGYCEALTDPSYFGQILVFTYPLIGNYGIPELPKKLELPIPTGFESAKIHASGVIVSIDSAECFHWRSFHSLDQWLKQQNVPGIVGLDTRHLVHMIRDSKNLLGRIEPSQAEGIRDLGMAAEGDQEFFDPGAHVIVDKVSTPELQEIGSGDVTIGLVDCGVKWNIVRQLVELDCKVVLIPWDYDLTAVKCDGWLVSNGPGDPNRTGDLIQRLGPVVEGEKPVLGICLGHQLIALAAGCKAERMSYGHRSHNQPVNLVGTRRGFISSQNHGYVVDDKSLPQGWEVWFRNANDGSVEGLKHATKSIRTVQFHPEAAGGPRDTNWILKDFTDEVKNSCR